MSHGNKEKKELDHDPVPGFRPAFYIIFAVCLTYLVIIFVKTW